ncbi:MAG: hypothetical protein RBR34_08405 [Rhodospirillaceae bacterium]|nr:hypothetical protein [Rhodospirillaceae bacterium]
MTKHIEEAIAHLGAALSQTIPSDDQIIMGHVRDAHTEARAAMSDVRRITKALHDALSAFQTTQRLEHYPATHWSHQAASILSAIGYEVK